MAQRGLSVSPDAYESSRAEGKTADYIADQMALSSPHFASQLTKIRKKYGADPAATEAFLNTRFYGDTKYNPVSKTVTSAGGEVKAPTGYVGKTLDRIYNAQKNFYTGIDQYNRGEITGGQAALRGAGQIYSGALSPVTEATKEIAGAAYNNIPGVKSGLEYLGSEVANSQFGQQVKPYIQQGMEAYQNLPQDSGYRDLMAGGQAGLDTLDVLGAQGAMNVAKRGAAAPFQSQTYRHPIQSAKAVWNGKGKPPAETLAPDETPQLTGVARKAVKAGMDENVMTFVAEQNPDTRAVMAKMTSAANEGGKQLGGTVAHKEILGGQMMDNAAYVLEQKGIVGKALGAMKSAVADDVVNLSDDYDNLLTELRNKGAVLNDKNQIISLAGAADDNIPILQKTLDFLSPDEAGNVARTGKEIDMWRTKMFQEMNSAKAKLQPSAAGQSTFGFAEKLTDDMRRSALVKMAKGNRNMIAANDAYEELSTQASKFLKSIQYKGKLDIESITAKELRAGEVALRTLGNASAESRDAFMNLIHTARKYGRISNVDEMALIRYADTLEDIFPIVPTRSLQGAMSRGTRDALGNFTEDVLLQGAKSGLTRAAVDKVGEGIKFMRGITPENRYKLLMEVLEAPPDTPFFTVVKKALPDRLANELGESTVKGVDAGDMKDIAKSELDATLPNYDANTISNAEKMVGAGEIPNATIDDAGRTVTDAIDSGKSELQRGATEAAPSTESSARGGTGNNPAKVYKQGGGGAQTKAKLTSIEDDITGIPKGLEQLAAEARKYKTFEEFGRAKVTPENMEAFKNYYSPEGAVGSKKAVEDFFYKATGKTPPKTEQLPIRGKPTPIPGTTLFKEDLPF